MICQFKSTGIDRNLIKIRKHTTASATLLMMVLKLLKIRKLAEILELHNSDILFHLNTAFQIIEREMVCAKQTFHYQVGNKFQPYLASTAQVLRIFY